eukprot:6196369-Pleurochrysis_carterae.AAC.3
MHVIRNSKAAATVNPLQSAQRGSYLTFDSFCASLIALEKLVIARSLWCGQGKAYERDEYEKSMRGPARKEQNDWNRTDSAVEDIGAVRRNLKTLRPPALPLRPLLSQRRRLLLLRRRPPRLSAWRVSAQRGQWRRAPTAA